MRDSKGRFTKGNKEGFKPGNKGWKKRKKWTRDTIGIDSCGYQRMTVDSFKRMRVHRKVVEDFIGRKLIPEEVVHHKNGIKTDNRIENLQIMTKSSHTKLHAKLRKEKYEYNSNNSFARSSVPKS